MKSLESRKLAEVNALVGAAILLSIVALAVETVVVKSHFHVLLSLTNICLCRFEMHNFNDRCCDRVTNLAIPE